MFVLRHSKEPLPPACATSAALFKEGSTLLRVRLRISRLVSNGSKRRVRSLAGGQG
jgi:hypothetical protein